MRRPLELAIIALAVAGCAERESEAPRAPVTPAVALVAHEVEASGEVIAGQIVASGAPVQYEARFEGDRLAHISERRAGEEEAAPRDYRFAGARLVRYTGPSLSDARSLDLQFDLQGRLIDGARQGVSEGDVEAILSRAQLLRSHALAQRDARKHRAAH